MSNALQRNESPMLATENQDAPQAVPSRRAVEVLPWLPCKVALDVAVVAFTVRTLLELAPGDILETNCHQSMDIPMRVNGLLLAWTEFGVVGERLAARITDLA